MADRQLVEFWNHATGVISEAFEIIEGLAAGQAAILRLAGGGAKGRQLGRIKAVTARTGHLRTGEINIIIQPWKSAREPVWRSGGAMPASFSLPGPPGVIQSVVQAGPSPA
jgi:hypothetical protein